MENMLTFITPDNYILNAYYLGPEKTDSIFIFVHGLSSSMFGIENLSKYLKTDKYGVLTFNNRGNGIISKIRKLNPESKKGYDSELIGSAHEIFTDCVCDIEGAINYALENKFKNIYLVGHSTGCQKIVYSASILQDKYKQLKGLMLLAPISDYAAIKHLEPKNKITKAYKYSLKKIKKGKGHEMLPTKIWDGLHDAQRFISLNDPNSEEEIFCYSQDKKPETLMKVKLPIIAIVGEQDQFLDRSAYDLMDWFKKYLKNNDATSVISEADHGFTSKEKEVSEVVLRYIDSI